MASSSSSGSADNFEISDITIKAPTIIASIKLSIDSIFQQDFNLSKDRAKEAKLPLATPGPSLLSSTQSITIKVRPEGVFKTSKKIEIKYQELLFDAGIVDVRTNKREYRTTVNGIQVAIEFVQPQPLREAPAADTDLQSTTDLDEIFEKCPRFRVLVIGRTGVGKTSLIMNTFGVTEARISHREVGECDINKELLSDKENKRFVLHDSMGFEPGDEENFKTVMKFLNDRRVKPDIKDQVHAVWLCFSIPTVGERLFETGAENFLRSLSDGKLDGIPIIAIFTKYDKLVDHIKYGDPNNFEGKAEVEAEVEAEFDRICIKPFNEHIGIKTEIQKIRVSTEEEYKWTLHELTQLTTDLVGKHLTKDIAVLSAVAQQVSPTVKLDAVIAVGKKRYWQGLASIIPGKETETVLINIHQDIIHIWNLQDPGKLLITKEFRELVNIIANQQQDIPLMTKMATSLSMLAALTGIVSALAGPAAPIVVPIGASLVLTHWTILTIKQASIVVQRVMTYIVALTIIMQIIFVLTTSTTNVVSRRLIKLALKTFNESKQQTHIVNSIKEHVQLFGRDVALQKITELIGSELYRISIEDMAEAKKLLKDFDAKLDEPW